METHNAPTHNDKDPELGKSQAAIVAWAVGIAVLGLLVLVLVLAIGPFFTDGRW